MAATTALILPESPSMKKAVSLINAIDIGRFPRLLTRILQKLHLKLETVGWQLNLQMAHSAQAKLKSPQAVLQLGVSNEDSKLGKSAHVQRKSAVICKRAPLAPHDQEIYTVLSLRQKPPLWLLPVPPLSGHPDGITIPILLSVEKVLVEFSHKELFDFYNKLETIQAQLDSLT
ncbi:COMM domain-containing protein 10 isoform X4 [Halichoerus grypus]|uniref:COMM domain-containing protein 10 isoform X5 n=1 Tax=Halichoerus grypus TaxID=9711 RepID=UPI001659F8EF|nr:COMM domain-containing protein 10 isoform X5 [Halichoerus grypus]